MKPLTTRVAQEVSAMAEIPPQWACREGPQPLLRPPMATTTREVSAMAKILP